MSKAFAELTAALQGVRRSRKLRVSNVSRASAIAERHLASLDDRRDLPLSLGVLQHPFQLVLAGQNIDVFEGDLLSSIVLTGLRCIGSGVLAKNQDFFLHIPSQSWILHEVVSCDMKISHPGVARREFNRRVSLGIAGFALLRGLPEADARFPLALVKNPDRQAALKSAFELMPDLSFKGKDVYLKGNFTSADPFPATTHPETLRVVVQLLLRDRGCAKITLVERSSMGNADEIWSKLGIRTLAKELEITLLPLESLPQAEWRKEGLTGSHWKRGIEVPKFLDSSTSLVQICNLKTHRFGGQFSASLKNSLGLVAKYSHADPRHNCMEELHESPDQRLMIAEVNQVYAPALVVMDAMQAFVEGGPEKGEIASPNVVAASPDRIAIDATGVVLLRIHDAGPPLNAGSVFQLDQLKRAVELKLGAASAEEIQFLTADPESGLLATQIKAILSDTGAGKEKKS